MLQVPNIKSLIRLTSKLILYLHLFYAVISLGTMFYETWILKKVSIQKYFSLPPTNNMN